MASAAPAAPDLSTLPEALRTLAARGVQRSYRKGTLIIEEGSHGDTLYLLLRGRVKAFSSDARGREVTYGVYGAGDYFGEMSLDGGPRSASVIAEVACVCAVLTRQSLHEHIAAEPAFAFELIGRVIRRARLATQSARSMALLDVYGRVGGVGVGMLRVFRVVRIAIQVDAALLRCHPHAEKSPATAGLRLRGRRRRCRSAATGRRRARRRRLGRRPEPPHRLVGTGKDRRYPRQLGLDLLDPRSPARVGR